MAGDRWTAVKGRFRRAFSKYVDMTHWQPRPATPPARRALFCIELEDRALFSAAPMAAVVAATPVPQQVQQAASQRATCDANATPLASAPNLTNAVVASVQQQNTASAAAPATATSLAPNAAASPGSNALQQFTTSGGQVLGFGQGSIIVASPSEMLQVDLVGASPVAPVSQSTAAQTGGSGGAAQAFTQVTYAGVWNGVTVVYKAQAGAIFEDS